MIFYGDPLFSHRGSSLWIDVEWTFPSFLLRAFCPEIIGLTGTLLVGVPDDIPATHVRKIASLVSKACYLWGY